MNETDAEIVATCEAAVTHLTEVGWHQGQYIDWGNEVTTWNADKSSYTVDYSGAEACLGGAIVLASTAKVFVDSEIEWGAIKTCPAIPAVAAVIREKHVVEMIHHPNSPETYDEATVYAFNDDEATKVDDVIDVLNETIKRHTSEVIVP